MNTKELFLQQVAKCGAIVSGSDVYPYGKEVSDLLVKIISGLIDSGEYELFPYPTKEAPNYIQFTRPGNMYVFMICNIGSNINIFSILGKMDVSLTQSISPNHEYNSSLKSTLLQFDDILPQMTCTLRTKLEAVLRMGITFFQMRDYTTETRDTGDTDIDLREIYFLKTIIPKGKFTFDRKNLKLLLQRPDGSILYSVYLS